MLEKLGPMGSGTRLAATRDGYGMNPRRYVLGSCYVIMLFSQRLIFWLQEGERKVVFFGGLKFKYTRAWGHAVSVLCFVQFGQANLSDYCTDENIRIP
jgi:hypothetical protein